MGDNVQELREQERWIAIEPLPGSFGAAEVVLRNVGLTGVQLEHTQPLRIGVRGRLWFRRGSITVATQGRVVWSHLSKKPDAQGKFFYQTGVRIEIADPQYMAAVQSLTEEGVLQPDRESLEKKKNRDEERAKSRSGNAAVKPIHFRQTIATDQIMLIRQAYDRLRGNPEEARKWHERARFSRTEEHGTIAAMNVRHREVALAVWESLERTVELKLVVEVLGLV